MKLYGVLFVFTAIVALQSCIKCREKDSYTGIVTGYYQNADCLWKAGSNGTFVINSQAQLDSVLNPYDSACDTLHFDFTNNTILGFGYGGGCHSSCVADVEINPGVYIYTLKTYDCLCESKIYRVHPNVVVVPKLPVGDSVQFVWKQEYEFGN